LKSFFDFWQTNRKNRSKLMKKQRVQLTLVKTIYTENGNEKEIWTTKMFNENYIEKIWNYAKKYWVKEAEEVITGEQA
jgi:hypothetical protein